MHNKRTHWFRVSGGHQLPGMNLRGLGRQGESFGILQGLAQMRTHLQDTRWADGEQPTAGPKGVKVPSTLNAYRG